MRPPTSLVDLLLLLSFSEVLKIFKRFPSMKDSNAKATWTLLCRLLHRDCHALDIRVVCFGRGHPRTPRNLSLLHFLFLLLMTLQLQLSILGHGLVPWKYDGPW